MFDPAMLPIANPSSPRAAASLETRNSGAEVPRPITTTLTTTGATRSRTASLPAPTTS